MPRIGTLWPHATNVAPVFGAHVTRTVSMGSQLGNNPLAIVLDGGGREAAVLALTEEGARQLARDLVGVLGPEAPAAAIEAKPPESRPTAEKPAETPRPIAEKPAAEKPADRPGLRR